jgi:peptidoglycan/LPS O-acetylase OafA/YrhL
MDRAAPSKQFHITALDGIRGLAVLMVMIFHFFQRGNFLYFPVGKALSAVSRIGQTGVDLFFVLSGFLITGILIDAKGSRNYLRNFYVRRLLRIFPLQYAALAFVLFVIPLIIHVGWMNFRDQLWGWLFAINIHSTFFHDSLRLPAHFWSLAVEEHFYLVWPTVVLLCSRRGLYRASWICIAISLIARVVMLKLHLSVFFFTLTRLDGLAIGALLALFIRGPRGPERLSEIRPQWLLAGSFILLAPMWVLAGGKAGEGAETAKYLLLALMYGALLAAALDPARPSIGHLFSNRILTTLGKYSYGLYVWDSILQDVLAPWVSSASLSRWVHNRYLLMLVCWVIQFSTTFLLAFLSWHLFEKQFLKLKRFFAYERPTMKIPREEGVFVNS